MTTYKDVIEFWQKQKRDCIEDYENLLENFMILFAYNSGVIENDKITFHDTREIFDKGKVINFTGDLKTLFEINNQKNCFEYLIKNVVEKNQVSEACIKKLHKILTEGTYDGRPGEYKKHDYVTGIYEVGSSAEKVGQDVSMLIEEMDSILPKTDEDVLTIAAYAHNVIEQIHPFADGNGRAGRALVNYILMLNDLPPIIIYDEDKKYYYEALEKFDVDEEIKPMVEFFKYEMEKSWKKRVSF